MIFNSIRWRLQAWHGLILVVVLAGFGITAYQVAKDNQFRRIDQDLDQRLKALLRPQPPEARPDNPANRSPVGAFDQPPGRRFDEPPGRTPQPPPNQPGGGGPFNSPGFLIQIREAIQQGGVLDRSQTNVLYYILWQQDGSIMAHSPGAPTNVPAPKLVLGPASQASRTPGATADPNRSKPDPSQQFEGRTRDQMRELYRPLPGGECLMVGRSLAPDLAALRRLALWLTAAGGAVLLVGLAGGWWLATRAIHPIEDISQTAVKISGGDLSQRIDVADTDSELGRLASVLNSTFARLEAAFAQQARFTSDASHELRTPVAVILSQTQTALSRQRDSSEYREALESCQRAAQRMRSLTESLLELARLDAGQAPIKREPFDLARVAHDCIELLRPLAAERRIQLQNEVPRIECLGDAERIGQVVTNLLTNAIHFNREQGSVHLSARAEGRSALLTVTDTGQGIAAEDIPHLFERFYRADKSRSRVQGRNGLGLAICKAIMDAHGGSIAVTSQPGVGSAFTVRLPQE